MHAVQLGPVEIAQLRAELDAVDESLVAMVVQRCRLARSLGDVKHAAGLPLRDPGREAAVVRRAAVLARASGVSDERVRQLFWVLIEMSRGVQTEQRS